MLWSAAAANDVTWRMGAPAMEVARLRSPPEPGEHMTTGWCVRTGAAGRPQYTGQIHHMTSQRRQANLLDSLPLRCHWRGSLQARPLLVIPEGRKSAVRRRSDGSLSWAIELGLLEKRLQTDSTNHYRQAMR